MITPTESSEFKPGDMVIMPKGSIKIVVDWGDGHGGQVEKREVPTLSHNIGRVMFCTNDGVYITCRGDRGDKYKTDKLIKANA